MGRTRAAVPGRLRSGRTVRIGAVVALSALVLSACTTSEPEGDSRKAAISQGGTLVDLQNFAAGDPDFIDPALVTDVQSSQIADLLFDGLTATDAGGRVQSAVAARYTSNEEATEWTFDLREDVKFSDGTDVDASSFKRGWERAQSEELGSMTAGRLAVIERVEANDEAHTLTVELREPDVDFPALVSLPVFSPIPASAPADAPFANEAIVGNGPFTLASWTPGQSITLDRNDDFYGGSNGAQANLDSIEFRISQDLESAYNDFASGGGEVGRFPSALYAELSSSSPEQLVNSSTMGVEYWGFNMADPTVGGAGNRELRQAINLAIDKEDLNDKVYGGARRVATQFSPPQTPGVNIAPDAVEETHNVEEARALLREWGGTAPALKVSYNAGAGHDDKAAIIVSNLNAIGIPAVADPLENAAYRQAVMGGTLQFFRFAWIADYASYDNILSPSFASANIGMDNIVGYGNDDVDDLLATAKATLEENERASLYREAEALILEDQPVVPIDWTTAGLITADNVRGLRVSPTGYVNYAEVWLDN